MWTMTRLLKDFFLSIQSKYNLKRNHMTSCIQLSSLGLGLIVFDVIYSLRKRAICHEILVGSPQRQIYSHTHKISRVPPFFIIMIILS